MMGHQKSKTAGKKLPAVSNRSSHTRALTRSASNEQPATALRDASTNPETRAMKRHSDDSPSNLPATKRPRR